MGEVHVRTHMHTHGAIHRQVPIGSRKAVGTGELSSEW